MSVTEVGFEIDPQESGYLERLVDFIAAEGCQSIDPATNLLRILLAIQSMEDEGDRKCLVEKLIYYTYQQTEDFKRSLHRYLKQLAREYKRGG